MKKWTRFDVKIFEVQPNLYIKSFWKLSRTDDHSEIIERLASIVIQAYDKELVKFDISLDYDCHYHVMPNHSERHTFDSDDPLVCAQKIESICNNNIQRFLDQHPNPNIRSIQINTDQFNKSISQASEQTQFYIRHLDELIKENHITTTKTR